jgi:hypothetical protein
MKVAISDAVGAINEQMIALDKRDKELAQEIRKVQQAVTDNQAALAEYKTSQEPGLGAAALPGGDSACPSHYWQRDRQQDRRCPEELGTRTWR